jgi:hypothetical protein
VQLIRRRFNLFEGIGLRRERTIRAAGDRGLGRVPRCGERAGAAGRTTPFGSHADPGLVFSPRPPRRRVLRAGRPPRRSTGPCTASSTIPCATWTSRRQASAPAITR